MEKKNCPGIGGHWQSSRYAGGSVGADRTDTGERGGQVAAQQVSRTRCLRIRHTAAAQKGVALLAINHLHLREGACSDVGGRIVAVLMSLVV